MLSLSTLHSLGCVRYQHLSRAKVNASKTVLADQQAFVEGMLEQVYGHLDDFQTASLIEDIQKELETV